MSKPVVIRVRSNMLGQVLFEYLPERCVIRIVRRGLVFEVPLDELRLSDRDKVAVQPVNVLRGATSRPSNAA